MTGWTYSKAGVDLSKHGELHEIALSTVLNVNSMLNARFGGIHSYAMWLEFRGLKIVLHVDGVGTKTLVASKLGNYKVIGWDAVIINVNDIVCEGAKPIALVDYIAMNTFDYSAFSDIINGIKDAALANGIALLGGETAILPDLINGIDVSCTLLGVKDINTENKANVGDVVVGLESSGIHANGFSLVRKVIEGSVGYDAMVDGVKIADELVKPIANYGPLIYEAHKMGIISAAAHITGGAFKKVKRILRSNSKAVLTMPKPPKIFEIIMRLGNIDIKEMYRVFNMGVGAVVTLHENNLNDFKHLARGYGINTIELGSIERGSGGVVINTYRGDIIEF